MKFIECVNFAVADRRLANTVTWYLNQPPNFNMRIPDAVRKCVVYLGLETVQGEVRRIRYGGTGFLIGIPSKIPGGSFLMLVTAKHVADKLGSEFYVRANTKDGRSKDLKTINFQKWYFHPSDKAADVALFPTFFTDEFDTLPLPSQMFLTEQTRQEKGIGIGDEVFITGLFVHHAGHSKNLPIVRTGNIAMIPDERIPINDFGPMETYLIEARSIGGLSGSPVFVGVRDTRQIVFHLLGLIHGHWDVPSESLIDDASPDAGPKAGVNVGIAIMTPASKILDIINGDELRKDLEKHESDEIARNSPTPDKT